MKKYLLYLIWWGVRFPVGVILGLITGITGTIGDTLVRVSDTFEGWATDWGKGFVPPWIDELRAKKREEENGMG